MIKFIKSNEISNVRYIPQFVNDICIIVEKDSKELLAYNQKFEIIWRVGKKLFSCMIVENIIVPDLLELYDLKGTLIYSKQKSEKYNRENIFYKSLTLWKTVDANDVVLFHVFDIQKKAFYKNNIPLNYQPVAFIKDNLLLAKMSPIIVLYDINTNTPLWQADVSELCGYELQDGEGFKKAAINNLLLDGDKVIVLAGLDVVVFDISNGDMLWHCKVGTAQSWGVIHGQFIYTTSNGTRNKIDLKTGNVIYQRGFEYIHINGEKKGSAISDLVWHNDFIWTVMDTSPNALLVIDPKTGKYVEVIPLTELGITSDCRAPVFHHGKMYLHDYNGTLHIFEEENVNT